MKHATCFADLGAEVVDRILSTAQAWKSRPHLRHLEGKILGMLFFNPSLRTRASFETVMLRGGGNAIAFEPGGMWKLEDRIGAIMNADRPEHLKEAVPVLSRFVDLLGVRSFSAGEGDDDDERDALIQSFRALATVPVVSMESAREHPCQGLADLMTLEENFGPTRGLPVTLTWAPHIKPLPKAVPNSFLLTAAARGCEIRLAHPPGFELHPEVMREAEALARASGGSISISHEQEAAVRGARAVYAKSWGPATAAQLPAEAVTQHPEWMVAERHFAHAASDAIFLHCLPVRRNVEVADDVLDGPRSRVTDEAENRFHVQRALLHWLLQR